MCTCMYMYSQVFKHVMCHLVFALVCMVMFSWARGLSPIPLRVKQCSVLSLVFISRKQPCEHKLKI